MGRKWKGIQIMNRILTLPLAAVMSALLSIAPVKAETPKDTLVVAQNLDDIIGVDPAFVFEISGGEVVRNVYDTLVNFDPENPTEIIGAAAERWTVRDDGKMFTFHLRDGMTFHSGNPVTADDVKWSLERIHLLDSTATWYTSALGWTNENVGDAVKVIDPLTVSLELKTEMAPFLALSYMTTVMTAILDREEVMSHEVDGDMGREWLKTHAAGSGPFKLKSMKPSQAVVLDAFEGYHSGPPKQKRVVIQHMPEASTQRLLIQKGDVDIAKNIPADQLETLGEDKAIEIVSNESLEVIYIAGNQKVPALSNPKVWQAIKWLVDYHGMQEFLLKDSMSVAQTFWPFDDNAVPDIYQLDVEKAKALLAEAGLADGISVTMDVFNEPPFLQIAQTLKSDFAKAGINLNIVPNEKKAVYSKARSRDFEMIMTTLNADFLDPHAFTAFFTRNEDNSDEAQLTGQLAWRIGWFIPGLTHLTQMAMAERDADIRNKMYKVLQIAVQQNSPFTIMFKNNYQTAVRSNVSGFKRMPPWDGMFYYSVSKD